MRIITGRAKGTRLYTLEGEETRPTTEKVKEAIFSMIQFDIEGRNVLDLFAGSGQLGLEAVSRGADSATLVEKSKAAVGIVSQNVEKTHFAAESRVICSDVLEFIRNVSGREKYDIVFIDPPYALKLVKPTLSALLEKKLLKPYSLIVCESGHEDVFDGDPELEGKFDVLRKAKYGIVYITVLKPKDEVSK